MQASGSVSQIAEGRHLWQPSKERIDRARMSDYMRWLNEERGLSFQSYDQLWSWSVDQLEDFWSSIWNYFAPVAEHEFDKVLPNDRMPGTTWFPGAKLNFAANLLRSRDTRTAVIATSESHDPVSLTYSQLHDEVAAVAAGLKRLGIKQGDRIVSYMPNIPETLVAFLATASIGAIWSSCSPEFGIRSVVDRFSQIQPKVLFCVDGYEYNGQQHDRSEAVRSIVDSLPDLEFAVIVPRLDQHRLARTPIRKQVSWNDLKEEKDPLEFAMVPFNHPLWIVYSSGTSGLPKPLVHGHGGILLEQLKFLALHLDLGTQDRLFWFSSTGWVMWNILISALSVGSSIILYDGSPAYPNTSALWKLAETTEATFFGASAPFISGCMKDGIVPNDTFDLTSIKSVGSTGAPLSPEGFAWLYESVGQDLLVASISGGTDVCTAFVGCCPILPVRAGEIQCRILGSSVYAFDEYGRPVVDELGELVVTKPLPSMPLFLWNDPDGRRYKESYFTTFPGIWRHGDWIRITPQGSCVITGRSDSTLKRGGIRTGTSDFYRIVEDLQGVVDSLIVEVPTDDQGSRLLLFVVLERGVALDDDLCELINNALRNQLSPRHQPDLIEAVPDIPRTLNGKKLEVPIKRILSGVPAKAAASSDAMSNPDSLQFFVNLAKRKPIAPS